MQLLLRLALIAFLALPMAASAAYPVVTHKYEVAAVDAAGQPMAGVAVEVRLESPSAPSRTVRCRTDRTGYCPPLDYQVGADPAKSKGRHGYYSSRANASATKDGYYPARGMAWTAAGSEVAHVDLTELRMQMVQPSDYLDDDFAVSAADRESRERVMRLLEAVRRQSGLLNAEVMLKGIGTSEFEGKNYLRLSVNSATTYNSLKLNKYDIGKLLFDETVSKVLNPLTDNVAAPEAYYGYDIVVFGHTKSFAQEYAVADKVEYRFLLPAAAVRRYKEKEISGQALLDAGAQLIDDRRVEFKLP